jgi:hypothetical protein
MKNNLFKFVPENSAEMNDRIAVKTEVPTSFRIHTGQEHNTRAVKGKFILENGSHHHFDLSALFAYRLEQELADNQSSIQTLSDLKDEKHNIAILAKNLNNITAILGCLPANSHLANLIKIAYPESAAGNKCESDFFFFSKDCKLDYYVFENTPSESMILIMKIYELLTRCNRYETSVELQQKFDAITARAFDVEDL